MSGKGGVGKSTISVLIAKELKKRGFKVGIMDADITGPSIPRLMGIKNGRVEQSELGLIPPQADGIPVMSLNLLLGDERQPVIWRGPIIAGTVKQFWEEVFWGDLDYLVIDLPPGTGDVALTVMQSIPMSGMVIVTLPQNMVSMIVAKAVNMVKTMKIPLIGVVENMSYIVCPDCGKKIALFSGKSGDFEKELGVRMLGTLPMVPAIAEFSDEGICPQDEQTNQTIAEITSKVIDAVRKEK